MWCCSFAGGDTRYVVCLHLSGASEAPGAVGGQRRGPLLCQDFQPAPLPLCRLFYSKTLNTSQTCIDFYQYCGLDLTSFVFLFIYLFIFN